MGSIFGPILRQVLVKNRIGFDAESLMFLAFFWTHFLTHFLPKSESFFGPPEKSNFMGFHIFRGTPENHVFGPIF